MLGISHSLLSELMLRQGRLCLVCGFEGLGIACEVVLTLFPWHLQSLPFAFLPKAI